MFYVKFGILYIYINVFHIYVAMLLFYVVTSLYLKEFEKHELILFCLNSCHDFPISL